MKKKIIYVSVLIFSALMLFKVLFKQNEIAKIREKHIAFLKNHRYQKTSLLSPKQRKSQGLPPNAYFEQEYLNEMNPYTGKTDKEKLYALQQELISKKPLRRVPGDGSDNSWIERGPTNVGGRTRAVLFDPNDATHETVFAGGVSGGLWKNTNISNRNSRWVQVGIPENLAVSCIAVDPNNTQIFYVGTGESYVNGDVNGNGLWRSIDGGNSWEKVLGGITGNIIFESNAKITVNSPTNIAGDYNAVLTTSFGGDLSSPITGDLTLVNDGTSPTDDACETITNFAAVNGKIAVIKRGTCFFAEKVKRAQEAGAIAVIMVNNVGGYPIVMGGSDASITIPSLMISKTDGETIINQLTNGVTATLTLVDENALNMANVPGIQHINDVVVRNNGGTSEVYVAVSESIYLEYSPSSLLGSDAVGLYKSTDGINYAKLNMPKMSQGNEYEPNNIKIAIDNSIYVSTNYRLLHGGGGGTIFKSTDGNTFNLLYTIPNGLRTEIALSPFNKRGVYVLAQVNSSSNPVKIFKTANDFSSITDLPLPKDADSSIPTSDFTRGQSGYDLLISVDPNNESILYVGGIDLFKSTTSGNNWNQISIWHSGITGSYPEVHSDQHGIAFAPGSSTKIVFSNDGGVYFSSDGGGDITARNRNYNTVQFYSVGVAPTTAFGGKEYFIAGAQDNGSQLFEDASAGLNTSVEAQGGDGGYSFFDQDGTDKYYITNYVFNSNIDLYNYQTNTTRTINYESGQNGSFINPQALDSNLDILYSNYSNSSSGSYIIKRYSNIKSGTVTKTDLTNGLLNSSPSALTVSPFTTTATNLYAGLINGELLKITNANSANPSWQDITGSEFVGSVSDVAFGTNENQILLTLHNYGVVSIWYSDDGGATWQNKEGDLPDLPVKAILQNPLNADEVIIGTDLGVWRTANFLAASPNWEHSYNGMSNVKVTDLDLRDDNTVFASTYGRGVFSGKFTSETASVNDVLANKQQLTIYPSISDGNFTIQAESIFGKSTLYIFDVNGKKVYTQKLDFSMLQKQALSVNLKSGIYIVNITDAKNRKASKKIIIK
ncbi:PA domain-containing protein [Tenacibaculum sp. UWU-22]|uniref:PA domain-containing protein n=1 Tax=Tenacibaculum sp. UWU-22 TaxID=3234187 RepID=UPI0034DAE81F